MSINVGINGFGRIGRLAIRAGKELGGFTFKAINDHKQPKQLAYLFKYDTVFGRYPGEVTYTDSSLVIDGEEIRVYNCNDPSELSWAETGAEYIIESTGKFKKVKDASKHLLGGAKKVIVTAPSDEAPTFVMGVNHLNYKPDMNIVSNASCTTNCLAPLVKIVHDAFGIRNGVMTTVHSATTSQPHLHRRGQGRGQGAPRAERQAHRRRSPGAHPGRLHGGPGGEPGEARQLRGGVCRDQAGQ